MSDNDCPIVAEIKKVQEEDAKRFEGGLAFMQEGIETLRSQLTAKERELSLAVETLERQIDEYKEQERCLIEAHDEITKLKKYLSDLNGTVFTDAVMFQTLEDQHTITHERREAERKAKAAEADNARLKELLGEMEWAGRDAGGWSTCPICGNLYDEDHSPTCRLAKALRQPMTTKEVEDGKRL